MSRSGDDQGEMHDTHRLSDRQVESLLDGRATDEHDGFDALAEFVRRMRAAATAPVPPAVAQRHIAAIVDAAASIGQAEPQRSASTRRRKTMLSTLLSSVAVKIAAGVMTAAAATAGLAAADVLPQPMQDAVATIAETVGADLPDANEPTDEVVPPVDESGDDTSSDDPETTDSPDGSDDGEQADEVQHGKSVADDVHAVLDDDTLQGRDKGQAVAEVASQNRQDGKHRPDVSPQPSDEPDASPETADVADHSGPGRSGSNHGPR